MITIKENNKWVSTGIKVVRGNKRIAMQKAEELREKFEKSFNLQNSIKQENDEQSKSICYLDKNCIISILARIMMKIFYILIT